MATDLRLDWCSAQAAKFACEKWHYAHLVPRGYPQIRIGIWEEALFQGAIIFGRGACSHLLSPYGLSTIEGAELVRVALRPHHTPTSKLVALSLKLLRRIQPKLRLIVSYADPEQGHVGSIYQAGNWIYTGQTATDSYYIDRFGRKWHSRNVSQSGVKSNYGRPTRSAKPSECRKVVTQGKYRYLYPLDMKMRQQLLPLAQPYPKRATSIASDASTVQVEEGGATPTVALSS